ncbi:hypothetical protein CFR78_04715 [Komagataeibacter rhaeticus]|uniref:Uncharacterized protein n=1 Tax=Komagataeibacter rhaeticus TaxID=215221 RepID=A0A181CA29_9PROT|nr:hypothetical protein [Komagataeibacter rhaeticus]ATU73045.1 hypothetical protein CT154_09560 [Komagataeibacter xylinus]EGG77136.1 hypothetical protein SXCC_02348 [Gluconacetobacter sp. SXCC-1]KDU97448.1 hypothetical protein GLUCORHAEAF1_02225 [Komagataeibacter rhaeticus AF1]MBL7238998.1 hypothetical protein [Komagataeibacter rhaeticus]PYD54266.1 hypothetical protein CFR78_04715 [Komagataeibacter rhaeticus]
MRRSLALFLPVTMLVLELNASAHAAAPTDPQPLIENAPGARVAGYLNFCIGNGLAPVADATRLLDLLIARTGAVPADERGNMDYALGTAGVIRPATQAGGLRLTDLDMPRRHVACTQVLTKAAMAS